MSSDPTNKPKTLKKNLYSFENITFWPVFHYRLEFAQVVRRALLNDPPEVVAVELPATWADPILKGVNRLPYLSLVLGSSGDDHLFLPIEPTDAGLEALRTAKELKIPAELIDLDVNHYPFYHDPLPDSHSVYRLGYEKTMEAFFAHFVPEKGELDEARETMMAHALQQLNGQGKPVACVLGAAHFPGVLEKMARPQPRPLARSKPRELKLLNFSERSSREFLSEPPFLAAAYEHARINPDAEGESPLMVDREVEGGELISSAVEVFEEKYKEPVPRRDLITMANFARKYAHVDRLLTPDLYHLVVAARGCAGDDFAYELWNLGSAYPWQDGSGLLPTMDLDEAGLYFEGRKISFHRKVRRNRPQLTRFSDKKRLRDGATGEWSGMSICSFAPEDLVIEEYGRYLKAQAHAVFSAERSRTQPFSASIKDGIDIRETLRNWHRGKTLYVKEETSLKGEVGSVVVVFDPDTPPENDRGDGADWEEAYPWLVTWHGEHEQESDMALYATPAGENQIGPGISRCEYGGFLMSYPPRRMYDVWGDPYFYPAQTKAERLLMAGLDYSLEKNVLYVAPTPPRPWFHSLAGRMGKKIIFLPLGQLSPGTVKKIRSFHVLDGHHVREYAKDYIDI